MVEKEDLHKQASPRWFDFDAMVRLTYHEYIKNRLLISEWEFQIWNYENKSMKFIVSF